MRSDCPQCSSGGSEIPAHCTTDKRQPCLRLPFLGFRILHSSPCWGRAWRESRSGMNYRFSLYKKILVLVPNSLKISSNLLTAEFRSCLGCPPWNAPPFFNSAKGRVLKLGMCSLMERLWPAFAVLWEWGWGAFLLVGKARPLAEQRTHALSEHLVLNPSFLLPHYLVATAIFQKDLSFLLKCIFIVFN